MLTVQHTGPPDADDEPIEQAGNAALEGGQC